MNSSKNSSNFCSPYLERIKESKRRIDEILARNSENEGSTDVNSEHASAGEFYGRSIRSYKSVPGRFKKIRGPMSEKQGSDRDKAVWIRKKSVKTPMLDKSVQVCVFPEIIKGQFSNNEKVKKQIRLASVEPKKTVIRTHLKPKNQHEFMKNYYKYYVKQYFPPIL